MEIKRVQIGGLLFLFAVLLVRSAPAQVASTTILPQTDFVIVDYPHGMSSKHFSYVLTNSKLSRVGAIQLSNGLHPVHAGSWLYCPQDAEVKLESHGQLEPLPAGWFPLPVESGAILNEPNGRIGGRPRSLDDLSIGGRKMRRAFRSMKRKHTKITLQRLRINRP